MAKFFNGIISEPMISYNDDQSIDFDTTAQIFSNLAHRGASGLFINGFGDETYSLSLTERLDIVKCAQKAVEGTDCLVVAVVFATCLRDALWLIREYKKLDVKAMCISLPPFYQMTPHAAYQYLSAQLKETEVPTIVFNCREMDQFASPELLGRLAHEFPNCQGYKDATRDIIHLNKCLDELDDLKEDFSIISGSDATLFTHMAMGASASVSFMSVPFLDQMKDIYDYFKAGEYEKAWQAQRIVLKLRTFMQQFPDSSAYIYAMKYTAKINVKGTRHPDDMLYIPEEELRKFDRMVEEFGILDR
ncbi:MAG TPA: dihydrodipicolinate synthase family protein [Candidatus Mediterraneibacter avicola]|nr:dihydrodipicolinate synthase family protein [Candidatus Mediterraneibacter avicola]